MPTLVSCPGCGISGELPDDAPGGVVGCPRCGARFATPERPTTSALASEGVDGLAVWVGSGGPDDTPPPNRNLTAPHAVRAPRTVEGAAVEITAENAAAHLDWLRQEVARFNEFVAQQFEQIQRGREETARATARTGAAFVVREQELNRERANLAARADALARRAEELDSRQAELDRRLAAVERMEADLRRRLAEADEVEDSLRAELEDREREVENRRRAVEEEARQLRTRTAPSIQKPASDPLGCWDLG